MESKVIRVINKMISNPKKIANVIKSSVTHNNEFFFLYKGKYKWSIIGEAMPGKDFLLFYYPSNLSLEQLSQMDERELEFITYKYSEYKTKEAEESFSELYSIVKAKFLGMDKVLDDILNDADDLPF